MEEPPSNFIDIHEVIVRDNFNTVEDRKPVIQNHNIPAEIEAKENIEDNSAKDDSTKDALAEESDTKDLITGLKETAALEDAAQSVVSAALLLDEAVLTLTCGFPADETEATILGIRQPLCSAVQSVEVASTLLEKAILTWKKQFSAKEVKDEPEDILQDSLEYPGDDNGIPDDFDTVGLPMELSVEDIDCEIKNQKGIDKLQDYSNVEHYKKLKASGQSPKNLDCEICGFQPQTKNVYRARQDHLLRVHFKDRIDALIPFQKPFECPQENCTYTGKDRQDAMRHFGGKHDVLKDWVQEFLDEHDPPENKDSSPNKPKVKTEGHAAVKYECQDDNNTEDNPLDDAGDMDYVETKKVVKKKRRKRKLDPSNNEEKLVKRRKRRWRCPKCDFIAADKMMRQQHMAEEHKDMPVKGGLVEFSCDKCDFKSTSSAKYFMHYKKEHGEGKIKCQDCDYTTGDPRYLRTHRQAKHEGKRYYCDLCDYSAMHGHNLREHKASKHLGIRHQCPHCTYTATLQRNLNTHIKEKHPTIRETHFVCNQCPFNHKELEAMNIHLEKEHKDVEERSYYTQELDVPIDPALFIKMNGGVKTKKYKPVQKKYYCDKCEYNTKWLVYLNEHIQTKHEDGQVELYSCDKCDFKGSSKSLRYHKQRHGQTFYCDQCEYSTWSKILLKVHIQSKHTKVGIKCDECDYVTTVTYYLTKHKKKMHQANKYHCDKCNFQCNYPSDLKVHQDAVHEGVKYSCDQCDYATRRRGDLNKHMRSVHEGVHYTCDHCSYTTTQKGFLDQHVNTKHAWAAPSDDIT
eukprot:TRINITY_DN2361_c0_g2_i2.p1 TRINITY_DN2361_c0_g2~~TRINITY_DN2361_c0_g2_i2.p1  ORF type:complete len:798 (-),score=130.93 TRINITY_DN2361_c0_g2_i2:206-2599(-)